MKNMDVGMLDELTYLLEPGSDRVGGLDFQASPKQYVPRIAQAASQRAAPRDSQEFGR